MNCIRTIIVLSLSICIGALLLLVGLRMALVTDDSGTANDASFDKSIKPMLAKHCPECHGETAKPKRVRLDRLAPAFVGESGEQWAMALDKVRSGEMPPKGKPRLPPEDQQQLQDWIQKGLRAAGEAAQKTSGRVPLRRLNRVEYENTVRHLLAIDTDLKELLPEDNALDGFDNNAEALSVSTVLMQRYMEAADVALHDAILHGPRPETVKRKFASFEYDRKPTDIVNSAASYRLEEDAIFFLDREIEHGFGGQDVLPRVPKGFPRPVKIAGTYHFAISGYGYPRVHGAYRRQQWCDSAHSGGQAWLARPLALPVDSGEPGGNSPH